MAKKNEPKTDPKTDRKSDRKSEPASSGPGHPHDPPPPAGDIALVLAKDADGVHILRRRSEQGPIEAGLLRPMREGRPIVGEVVSLTRRQDLPMIYDVKSEFDGSSQMDIETEANPDTRDVPEVRLSSDGPAQVASEAYRKGWEAVWGRRRDRSVN